MEAGSPSVAPLSVSLARNLLLSKRTSCAKCGVWKQGRRGWSHEREREDQELKNRLCSHNIESEPRAQTFMFRTHPSPLCPSQWTKLPSHWRSTSPKTSSCRVIWLRVLCTRKFICLHVFLFAYVCMWPIPICSWEVIKFLITPALEEYTRPWSKMVSPMTQNRVHVTCVHIFLRAHTRKSARSTVPSDFVGSSHDHCN